MTGNTESGRRNEGRLQVGLSKGSTGVRFCCAPPRDVNTSCRVPHTPALRVGLFCFPVATHSPPVTMHAFGAKMCYKHESLILAPYGAGGGLP
jgi:hypothetical protein